MASKKIQKIVDRFVSDIIAATEADAMERIKKSLGIAVSGAVGVKRRRSSNKGKSMLRPCPVGGCKATAAPRYQMVCKKHSALPREDILIARDIAEKPGGIWYEMKHGEVVAVPAPKKRKKKSA